MSCFCLASILGLLLKSFSVVAAAIFVLALFVYSLKVLWEKVNSERGENSDEYQEGWYGKECRSEVREEDTSIRPFKISVADSVLEDLKSRLERTRFEEPLVDSKFLYGFNPNYLRKVVEYWSKDYDWRKHEERLNQYPHFKTRIEGIDVHFLHAKPDLPADSKIKVLPLMLIHGWPGSVLEFYKIIPLLTTPVPNRNFVFEVICPSIPGYGFSESPHRQGFDVSAAGRVFVTLMNRLGFPRFYVQGGDWGAFISSFMARNYPTKVLGLHVNLISGNLTLWEKAKLLLLMVFPFVLKEEDRAAVKLAKRFKNSFYEEFGYAHIQSTKPDTIGCAIADSPAGLAAYILEKFSYWTNPDYLELKDGGITNKFSLDDLLTNVTIYWVNNNFTASVRFYKENLPVFKKVYQKKPILVPTAIAVFPNELMACPKSCLSQIHNLVSYKIMPRGGHFAAFEEPEILAEDIWTFVSNIRTSFVIQ